MLPQLWHHITGPPPAPLGSENVPLCRWVQGNVGWLRTQGPWHPSPSPSCLPQRGAPLSQAGSSPPQSRGSEAAVEWRQEAPQAQRPPWALPKRFPVDTCVPWLCPMEPVAGCPCAQPESALGNWELEVCWLHWHMCLVTTCPLAPRECWEMALVPRGPLFPSPSPVPGQARSCSLPGRRCRGQVVLLFASLQSHRGRSRGWNGGWRSAGRGPRPRLVQHFQWPIPLQAWEFSLHAHRPGVPVTIPQAPPTPPV